MPSPVSPRRPRLAWLVAAALLFLGAAAGARLALGRWAATKEAMARRAWGGEVPVPFAPRPMPNDAALKLEEEARAIGLELAPRGSARARPPRPPGILALVHDGVLAMALEGATLDKDLPALHAWWLGASPDIERIAAGIASRETPLWETPAGRRSVRVPPPEHRADTFLTEASRLELRDPAGPLGGGDAHLARAGIPRLSSLVLLDEILVIDGLQRGRTGDMPGALTSLTAAERLIETVLTNPDAFTLGIGIHLARLHAAALRQLPVDEWPRGVLDASLAEQARQALTAEAADLTAHATDGPPVARDVFSPTNRASAAVSSMAVKRMIELIFDDDPCDMQSKAAWQHAITAAPAWDPAMAGYLANLADLPHRAGRADVDRELTRRIIELRGGRPQPAPSPCAGRRFTVGGTPDAPRIRYAGPVPDVAVPMPFELPLEASP